MHQQRLWLLCLVAELTQRVCEHLANFFCAGQSLLSSLSSTRKPDGSATAMSCLNQTNSDIDVEGGWGHDHQGCTKLHNTSAAMTVPLSATIAACLASLPQFKCQGCAGQAYLDVQLYQIFCISKSSMLSSRIRHGSIPNIFRVKAA